MFPCVYLSIGIDQEPVGNLVFDLRNDACPKTVLNFMHLAAIKKYKGTEFHRAAPGFMAHVKNVGVYPRFPDEHFEPGGKHRGLISIANQGPEPNGCQFFVTLTQDSKHTVFGYLVEGNDTLAAIEQAGGKKVVISDCGAAEQSYSQWHQDTLCSWILESMFGVYKTGFFCDVGANDGVCKSNSYMFAKRGGWSGVCIEAHPDAFAKLVKNRRDSVNVCCAAFDDIFIDIPL